MQSDMMGNPLENSRMLAKSLRCLELLLATRATVTREAVRMYS